MVSLLITIHPKITCSSFCENSSISFAMKDSYAHQLADPEGSNLSLECNNAFKDSDLFQRRFNKVETIESSFLKFAAGLQTSAERT